MEQITSALLEAGVGIALAVISLAATFAILYLNKLKAKANAEISKIENEDTQEFANSVLNRVFDTLSISIDKMEVTLVKELKAVTEDGKLTKDDQKKVATAAYELFLEIANQDLLTSLEGIVGDTETYIYSLIDSIVLEKKNDLLKAGVITSTPVVEDSDVLND